MTTRLLELYNNLMQLVAEGDTFYFQDFNRAGTKFRIFNYRLSSYTDFLKPDALECRGIMFQIDDQDQVVSLASRPMQKFFNLNENPMTMNLDLSLIDTIESKADGSLMSTYVHMGELLFKSRGSLFSEQAVDASAWIVSESTSDRAKFYDDLKGVEKMGYTVNLEWCAPHNRIVIGYLKPQLTVLNARNRETGEYMPRDQLEVYFESHNLISRVELGGLDPAEFVKNIPAMQDDIEGFVVHIGNLWFKVKTDKYCSLHHAKDSINNPRRLFEAVVDEGIDDLRSMFVHDALAIKQIDEMQEKVKTLANHLIRTIEDFYAANKHLDRKEYAIKGKEPGNIDPMFFGLAMNKYLQRPVNYKDFLKSKYKELGFKDEKVVQDE